MLNFNWLFDPLWDFTFLYASEPINNHCGMLGAFEHWQQTHIRQAVSRPALLAGIMGLGCGIGVRKMARISSRVTEGELEHVVNGVCSGSMQNDTLSSQNTFPVVA